MAPDNDAFAAAVIFRPCWALNTTSCPLSPGMGSDFFEAATESISLAEADLESVTTGSAGAASLVPGGCLAT